MAEADWRKNLRYFRKKLGKTQSDIAGQLNVKQQTIVGYENGPTNPSIDDLIKITKYLGITINQLFSNTDYSGKENTLKTNREKIAGLKNYTITEEVAEFSLNEPSPSDRNNLFDHLKALALIYNDDIKEIRARLTELEDKVKSTNN